MFLHRKSAWWILGLVLTPLIFFYGATRALIFYENVAYAMAPSAQRAFAYGERHFDAADSADYDINRAEYFLNLAATKDPNVPYLYHELARISFLRGDFKRAMAQISFQINLHGDTAPNSYYIRGLIEGYMGDYADSARDYEQYLQFDPRNWAALNDYAWVLLKAERFSDAADVTNRGLASFPDNPWLLNSHATALYELGRHQEALVFAQKASLTVGSVTEAQWSRAYPGNDPKIAAAGLSSFKKAVSDNMHTIELALASSTVQ